MTLCIIPGPKKPYDLMSFLKPVIDEISLLGQNGLIVKKNDQVVYEGKVYLLGITGDIPGIADIMKHQGHMSYHGCRICITRGTRPFRSGMSFMEDGRLRTWNELVNGDPVRLSCIQ